MLTLNNWHVGLAVQHAQLNHRPGEWDKIVVVHIKIKSEPTGADHRIFDKGEVVACAAGLQN